MNCKLEYYVLNYDFNSKKVIYFDIFNNFRIKESVKEHVEKYLRNPKEYEREDFLDNIKLKGYEALKEDIRISLMSQFWSRREYEISVGDAFEEDINKLEKWDVYKQLLPNLDVIVNLCINYYKEKSKK